MAGRVLIFLTAVGLAFVAILQPARAQGLIRDAEIEYSLQQLARPLLNAAGLSPNRVKVYVLADSSLNAFVIDSEHIFVHSGLILKLQKPEMLQAVFAHEIAHIANGHITRRLTNAANSRTAAGLGILLSAAVAATGNGQAAAGVAAGTSGTAQRLFLAHTRSEESSADQSGARFMASAGVDPAAMIEVLEIFRGQEALAVSRQDPYAQSHPLSRDRLRAARGYAAAYTPRNNPENNNAYWFARARGKLEAFIRNPSSTLRKIDRNDNSDIALMRRAVAYHRMPNRSKALENINALAARRPSDPFVHELLGQIHLESRDARSAVRAYSRAVELSPRHPLLLAGYGRALLALDTADGNRRALRVLEQARARDAQQPRMLRDLAVAYAKSGNNGMASLTTAERYALLGRLSDARIHATRAEALLPRGSTGWNLAQDVLRAADAATQRR
ncbi:M48 family metalloprotease [Pseudohalocynthiibacter aestuariivivens]|jgi:predicted Zn-dependent protease|uniref:M48 family metalloprotease n=1 Tax=Pseudohalocynthiibacter aestuariivivens TaxID=1591409 RepID=A0ABV5JCI5_9RHOB|nr:MULTISPECIES: M48 family metalloprotease [Pseudohalocynthiibacter]MBS9718619.1 M48 family metalloprotease [Pseudohalocynthiibacter aestuariivivens]MCK0103630.1 M48 family metalloprotease [Pseudohalocynthiibacter sp. F2068]